MPGRGEISLGARFVVLAAISLTLMVVDQRQDHLTRVRQLLTLAVYPIHIVVDLPFAAWSSLTNAVSDRGEIVRENDRLRDELILAEYRLQRVYALERENERLRELLDSYEEFTEERVLIAQILSVDLDYRQRFIINRGSADDVYVGQPLFDADGVVGQVASVSMMTSEALLITDANHAIPVAIERTMVRTIAEGMGDSGLLRLLNLPNNADVAQGDLVVTSGLGDVFPAGRPVGIVEEFVARPGQSFAHVTARPVAALDRDQEVLLVWHDRRDGADQTVAEVVAK
jgi:rod shape-determining protein MreC